jgi:hypothetical protein
MTPLFRPYPEIVRDLLTQLTGGISGEVHEIGATLPDAIMLRERPVARVSHLEGEVLQGEKRIAYRFTERDFELIADARNANDLVAIRFRPKARRPAPDSLLTINYYPVRRPPLPLSDINVGSVVRTLLETAAREMATQYQQLQRVYESGFVETATGTSLDNVVALLDIRRLQQGHPVGKVRFARRPGSPGAVFIPQGTAVTDGAGQRYLTSAEATLQPGEGSIEVWVQGESSGTKEVKAASLSVVERAIAGIERVANEADTFRATEAETDAQLAARARRAIHTTGQGTLDALREGLLALPGVAAVAVTEWPDPLIALPGMLRLDVALNQDSPDARRLVAQRIEALRPAGIVVEHNFAGRVRIGFRVALRLAAGVDAAAQAQAQDGVAERLIAHVRSLSPGEALRRARLSALALEDARVLDATITASADGTPIAGDSWQLPANQAAEAGADSVTFESVAVEGAAAGAAEPVLVDAHLVLSERIAAADASRTAIATSLGRFLDALAPGAPLDFAAAVTALRDDAAYVIDRASSVLTLHLAGGAFLELRDGDAPFAGTRFAVGDVLLEGPAA